MSNVDDFAEKILEPFQEIFAAMDISDTQINLAAEKFSLPKLTGFERDALSEGLPIDEKILAELMKNLSPTGHYAYKEHVVLLYLRDQYLSRANYERGNYNRFHLCYCQTLRTAKKNNRYEARFVVTYDKSGNFLVNLFTLDGERREQNVYRRLKVCQHCLREINWKNFRRYCGAGRSALRGGDKAMRLKIVEEFDIAEYLLTAQKNSDFPPVEFTDVSAVKKIYDLNPKIKAALKKIRGCTCELCRKIFSPDELEIHHRNHNQGDNRHENLMLLCKNCHRQIHAAEGGVFAKRKTSYADELKILFDIARANNDAAAKIFYRNAINVYQRLGKDFDTQFELANLYLRERKTFTASQKIFRKLSRAEVDGVKQIVRVGLIYAKGLGGDKNLSKARKFFETARSERKEEIFFDSEFLELAYLVGAVDFAKKFHAQAIELLESAPRKDTFAVGELVKLYGDKNFLDDFDTNAEEGEVDPIKIFLDDAKNLFAEKVSSHEKILRQFNAVKEGDLNLVAQLKNSARCGDSEAQTVLEKLYCDAENKNPCGVIVLREGITRIEDRQFFGNRQITHVVFPETLTEIGDEAFRYCGLKNLVLPAALTKIGEHAFQDSVDPVETVTYSRRIEWQLKKYFGTRWETVKKFRRN